MTVVHSPREGLGLLIFVYLLINSTKIVHTYLLTYGHKYIKGLNKILPSLEYIQSKPNIRLLTVKFPTNLYSDIVYARGFF